MAVAATTARQEMYMMENAGFATDDDSKVSTTTVEVETSLTAEDNTTAKHNGDIQTHHHQDCEAAPVVAAVVTGASQCDAGRCEEANTTCSCVVQKPRQKVELQSWVHPKGWVLLGVVLCLTAWIIVYFTVTHFYEA